MSAETWVWNMNVVKLLCSKLQSDNTIHLNTVLLQNCRINQRGSDEFGSCPLQQHLSASFTNLLKLSSAARFLPRFLLGLACFLRLPLLSSAIITLYFVSEKSCPRSGASVCLSWEPAWEWMVMRHRLRSQRETQTLMGLQARRRAARKSDVSSRGGPEVSLGIVNVHLPHLQKRQYNVKTSS